MVFTNVMNDRKLICFYRGGGLAPDPKSYDQIFVTTMLGCPQLVIPSKLASKYTS